MPFSISTNARDLQRKYNTRCERLITTTYTRPQMFAVALSKIRRENIQKLVYQRTPYMSEPGSKKPTFKLLEGEKAENGMVFNDVEYASRRMEMKGMYSVAPGISREADWGKISIEEFLPVMRLQQAQINRNILNV